MQSFPSSTSFPSSPPSPPPHLCPSCSSLSPWTTPSMALALAPHSPLQKKVTDCSLNFSENFKAEGKSVYYNFVRQNQMIRAKRNENWEKGNENWEKNEKIEGMEQEKPKSRDYKELSPFSRNCRRNISENKNQLYVENEDIDIFTIKRRNLMLEIQRPKIIQLTLDPKTLSKRNTLFFWENDNDNGKFETTNKIKESMQNGKQKIETTNKMKQTSKIGNKKNFAFTLARKFYEKVVMGNKKGKNEIIDKMKVSSSPQKSIKNSLKNEVRIYAKSELNNYSKSETPNWAKNKIKDFCFDTIDNVKENNSKKGTFLTNKWNIKRSFSHRESQENKMPNSRSFLTSRQQCHRGKSF